MRRDVIQILPSSRLQRTYMGVVAENFVYDTLKKERVEVIFVSVASAVI